MKTMPSQKEMTRAFLKSDSSYDGVFFTGVKTTGIFCLPSCRARKPKVENITFHRSIKEALFSGFRACKKCKPLRLNHSADPEWAIKLIQDIDGHPQERIRDGNLRERGLEPATVRRFFLKRYGLTFHAYQRAVRLGQALESIREGGSLDDAAFEGGYESTSGFREAFQKKFQIRAGQGKSETSINLSWIESPVGPLVVGASPKGICLLEFTDRRMLEAQFQTLQKRLGRALIPKTVDIHEELKTQLQEYFSRKRKTFDLPLDYPGTEFQVRVWQALLKIPYGETRSYQDVAKAMGDPKKARAVGTANGLNRIAIVIPCHRVVNQDGRLGGYGGGLWRKQHLLDLETSSSLFSFRLSSNRLPYDHDFGKQLSP